jgi:hypothetical protein
MNANIEGKHKIAFHMRAVQGDEEKNNKNASEDRKQETEVAKKGVAA